MYLSYIKSVTIAKYKLREDESFCLLFSLIVCIYSGQLINNVKLKTINK